MERERERGRNNGERERNNGEKKKLLATSFDVCCWQMSVSMSVLVHQSTVAKADTTTTTTATSTVTGSTINQHPPTSNGKILCSKCNTCNRQTALEFVIIKEKKQKIKTFLQQTQGVCVREDFRLVVEFWAN